MSGSRLWRAGLLGIVGLLGTTLGSANAQAEQADRSARRSVSGEELAALLKSGESLDSLIEAFDIPPGETVVIEFEVNVDNPVTAGASQISNQGTVTGIGLSEATDDPDTLADDDATITPLEVEGDLSVTKTDGVTTAVPGQSLNYTIVASNAGPSVVSDAAVMDTFPSGLLCTWTSMAAGGATGNTDNAVPAAALAQVLNLPPSSSVTYSVSCSIPSSATGTLSNTVTISSMAITDPVAGNNSATDGDTVLTPEADLGITKTDGVTSAVPGNNVVYTLVASNAGPSDDPSVTVADTFPASLSCGWTSVAAGGATGNTTNGGPANLSDTLSMPAGSSVTYTVTCGIDPAATGTLSNTATISGSATDGNSSNDSATDNDTVLSPMVDVSITKTDGVTSAVPGQNVVYTIVAANAGPSTDPSVSVADTFPASLSCGWTSVAAGGATGNTNNPGPANLADTLSLPPGSSVTYTATCNIDPAATGTLSNTATATASVTDTVPGNNSATDGDTVLDPEADLGITKDDGVTTVIAGNQVVYTIVASNAGPSAVTDANVVDNFPAALTACTWTSVAAGGATGNSNSSGLVLNDTLDMPPGSSVTYTVTCDVDISFTGFLSNTATISTSVTDPNSGNDSASDTDTEVLSGDTEPPEVDGVDTEADTGDGALTECETSLVPIRQILVTFSEPMRTGGGADAADDAGNYEVRRPGADRTFGTGDDVFEVPFDVTYLSEVATLSFGGLPNDLYRFTIDGAVADLAGNGIGGGVDFVLDFRVDVGNRLANGHFDCDLGSWTEEPPAAPEIGHDATTDGEGSPHSGSAQVANSTGTAFALSQCVAVDLASLFQDNPFRLGASFRLDAAAEVQVGASAFCRFFDQVACAGNELGTASTPSDILEDTSGQFLLRSETFDLPVGALSAQCQVDWVAPGAEIFTGYADDIFLNGEGPIFEDGFESGDTSAWSSSVN